MTFANVGTIGTLPDKRDELVAHLTARSELLSTLGCHLYEVGVSDAQPDTVFVMELWDSAKAHRASLQVPEIRESMVQARPWLSGEFSGFQFTVKGSPLRG
jgi:quinol monooxygenase YgiN